MEGRRGAEGRRPSEARARGRRRRRYRFRVLSGLFSKRWPFLAMDWFTALNISGVPKWDPNFGNYLHVSDYNCLVWGVWGSLSGLGFIGTPRVQETK